MSYFKEAVNAIEEFSKRFRKNPWDYLYEADVQFELMQCLKEQIKTDDLKYDKYKINVVKSEYPGAVASGDNRFDIVAIDPCIRSNDSNICNLPVSIAMELKLNIGPSSDIGDYIYDPDKCTLEKDLNKFKGLNSGVITTAGFAILCVKPYPQKDDLFDKAKKYLEKDKNRFNLTRLESKPIHSEPSGIYAVIIDGKENGSNQYFKLIKPSA